MGILFFILGTYLLIKIFLIGVGVGVGVVLHWLLPAVDLGMAILIGVIATGLSIHFYTRLTAFMDMYRDEDIEPEPRPILTLTPVRSTVPRRRKKPKPPS